MERKSPSISCREVLLLLLAILLMNCQAHAAKIYLGIGSEATSISVEKSNPPDSVLNETSSGQTVPAALSGTTVSPPADTDAGLAQSYPHLFASPKAVKQLSSKLSATVQKVLQSNVSSQEQTLTGKGEKELIALADGEVALAAYLYTYRNASIVARLYDEEGNEIRFAGQPLLSWVRANDTSYAPIQFKGQTDASSMFEESSGNYSPVKGISYKFNIRKGQKLVLSISGAAEDDSYVRAEGAVF
jgi:hypothetical protein